MIVSNGETDTFLNLLRVSGDHAELGSDCFKALVQYAAQPPCYNAGIAPSSARYDKSFGYGLIFL